MQKYCLVLTTIDDETQAGVIAKGLCENKLAACVQIVPVKSHYYWKDQFCSEPEFKLEIKTQSELYPKVEEFILKHHTYETPEIVQIPIEQGYVGYLAWITETTKE